MRAISLRQPIPWAMFNAGMDVLSMNWKPPRNILSKVVGIHAAKIWEPGEQMKMVKQLRTMGQDALADQLEVASLERGSLLGIAMVDGYVIPKGDGVLEINLPRGASASKVASSPWATGQTLWSLSCIRALPRPTPVHDGTRIWTLEDELVTDISRQLENGHG